MVYECPHCSEKFTRKCKLEMHKCEKEVDDAHICEDCNQEFDSAKELKTHICPQVSSWVKKNDKGDSNLVVESNSGEDDSADEAYRPKKRKYGRKRDSDAYSDDSDSDSKAKRRRRRPVRDRSKSYASEEDAPTPNNKLAKTKNSKQKVRKSEGEDGSEDDKETKKTSESNAKKPSVNEKKSNGDDDDDDGLFKCPDCGAKFSREATMKTHYRTHTGDLPFKCDQCDQKFAYHASLKSHLRSHIENIQQPYKCKDCGATFAAEENLDAHAKTHERRTTSTSSSSILTCDKCKSIITTPGSHTCISEPLNDRPHVCGECGVRYRAETTLIAHLRVHKEQD